MVEDAVIRSYTTHQEEVGDQLVFDMVYLRETLKVRKNWTET